MNIKFKKAIAIIAVLFALSLISVSLAVSPSPAPIPSMPKGGMWDVVNKLIGDFHGFIIGISIPAALIGVGFGAFTMKFAGGGDDSNQKRAMGKKAITTSIIGWAAINGLALLLSTLSGYLGSG